MVLRVGDENGLPSTAIINAIQYATNMGAHVINCSWGSYFHSHSLKNAINASSAVFVCAAGNDASDNDVTPYYPASYASEHIIAVAATNQFDDLSMGTNYGPTSVDVGAPGANIFSCFPGNDYRYLTGSSMAAACCPLALYSTLVVLPLASTVCTSRFNES